jgi:hypothetical protein
MTTIPNLIREMTYSQAEKKAEIARLERTALKDERLRNLEAALTRKRAEDNRTSRVMIGAAVLVALVAFIVLLLSRLLS